MAIEILTYILLAFALSTSAFSISLYSSIHRCVEIDEAMTMGLSFSLFSGVLLILGWLIGTAISGLLAHLAFPLATLILFFVGFRKLADSRKASPEQRSYADKNIRLLMGFSLAQSINAFLTGVGLGLVSLNIWLQAAILVFIVFLMTQIGIRLGKFGRYKFGMQSEAFGGLVIIAIAVIMLIRFVVN